MKEELKTQVNAKLDEEFVYYMLQIESRYSSFVKHDKIRIEQWVRPSLYPGQEVMPGHRQCRLEKESKSLCHAPTRHGPT